MGITASKVPLAGHVTIVTGCDTGFGNETAIKLAAVHKAVVYATCLTDAGVRDFERLRREKPDLYSTLRPVKLDVTDWDAVQAFAEKVDAECPEGVYCLLNNAGVNIGSYFTWTSVEEFRKVIDVNLMGALYMMKAFVPSMRRFVRQNPTGHAPRIVNITSVAGRTALPVLSAYCTSKYALEALSDSVRMELRAFGIRVALIEPWFASTPMVVGNYEEKAKAIRARYQSLANREDYGSAFLENVVGASTKAPGLTMDPKTVINALIKTIEAQEPKHRRVVGLPGSIAILLYSVVPSWLTDGILIASLGAPKPHGAVRNGRQGLLSWL
ncbi:Retinol dehydrogenase 5 [Geranomyces variabilis]|uniref:Retinol dehydrogenase 5 n=1 Tax=Geranomyces variabilis TaxID=109894 RepID=A0AAD5XRG0_9FUNG|nr:Retinol dehydrogenase 5 [Geranomyces variabilis]